jgi:hypothetical protein
MIEDISSRTLGIVDKHDIMGMILLNELGSYLTTTSLSSIRCGLRYVQLFGLSFTGLNIKFMLPINLNTTVDAFDTRYGRLQA